MKSKPEIKPKAGDRRKWRIWVIKPLTLPFKENPAYVQTRYLWIYDVEQHHDGTKWYNAYWSNGWYPGGEMK